MSTPEEALRLILFVLEELRIPFLVGGSVAASVHGTVRATMDVDLLARLFSGSV